MDFSFDESQLAVRELAKNVFARAGHGREQPEQPQAIFRELGRAQLLGVALPTEVGGMDAGLVSLCVLLEQAGAAASMAPLLPALVLAGLPLARSGRAGDRLKALCAGETILCGALGSHGESALRVRREGPDYILAGSETCVEALPLAAAVVVAARTDAGSRALFLVDTRAPAVHVEVQSVASGCSLGSLALQDLRVGPDALLCDLGDADELVDWTLDRAYLAQCAYELGLCEGALALTAKYAGERQQFGRPIGTFQAVAQRIADAHIAVETMRLTLWRAAWLAERGSDARREIAVARTIATRAGHDVVCAAQHIHGGMGFARDYPLHRYFLASKQNELRLGGHGFHVARLGKMLAA